MVITCVAKIFTEVNYFENAMKSENSTSPPSMASCPMMRNAGINGTLVRCSKPSK